MSVKADVRDSLHTFYFSSALHFVVSLHLRAKKHVLLKVTAPHDRYMGKNKFLIKPLFKKINQQP